MEAIPVGSYGQRQLGRGVGIAREMKRQKVAHDIGPPGGDD